MVKTEVRYYIAKKSENRVHELTDSNVSRPIRVAGTVDHGSYPRVRAGARSCTRMHLQHTGEIGTSRDFAMLRK